MVKDQQLRAIFKLHAGVRANENMLGHFWIMATARAEDIVPFCFRATSCRVAEWPETNLENHNLYRGKLISELQTELGNVLRQSQWGRYIAISPLSTCKLLNTQDAR